MTKLHTTCIVGLSSVGIAMLAGYLFLAAMATASGRFWYCGPTSLDHADPACRIGTKLLLASYGSAATAIMLGLAFLWLHVRRRKAVL
jgi:hypothetical protein